MTKENLYDKLRIKCHNDSFQAFGYKYIFDERIKKFKARINALTVFGILVPALIGATVLGYGIKIELLSKILWIAIPLVILQFAISIFSIIYNWSDELMYAFEASQSYNALNIKLKQLGEIPPDDFDELQKQYDLLNVEFNFRSQQDIKHNISEWELRKGMRFSLRQHAKECVGCKSIPLSMESTNCPVCGQFSFIYQFKILSLCRPSKM